MKNTDALVCPVCGSELYREGGSLYCRGGKKHCFDIASSGYVNLCPGRASGGDDKKAVRSRTEFLNLGYYAPIAQKLCELLSDCGEDSRIVDAGCGEGYYTNAIASATGAEVLGFDLSKDAITAASKSASRLGLANASFFVGGIYALPLRDGCADALVNIFAPCAESEFSRVLAPHGRLIEVVAGKDHLLGLKRAVYDTVYTNEPRADMPKNMKLTQSHKLSYKIELDSSDAIRSLFSMTPYSYRTSERDMGRLLSLESLTTEVEVDIYVYEGVDKNEDIRMRADV